MSETSVFQAILDAEASRRAAAVATVVRTRGSTPRHAGSRMVIDGERLVGTIGGGCGEADVIAAAEDVLRTGQPTLLRVELTDPVDSWSPAVCGGVMDVLIERVGPGPAG